MTDQCFASRNYSNHENIFLPPNHHKQIKARRVGSVLDALSTTHGVSDVLHSCNLTGSLYVCELVSSGKQILDTMLQ